MDSRPRRWPLALAGAVVLAGSVGIGPVVARSHDGGGPPARHVLLISVDGLHASDLAQCESTGLCPTLAALAGAGTTYAHASASEPSDSSPGLMALVTGGTPKITGVYYDDSYDRTMYLPPAQTASGTQDCSGPAGAEAMYFENIDANAPTFSNPNGTRPILGDTIDPAQLGRKVVDGQCVAVWPNDFLRTNSIFSVAHAAGLRTAWADKHPAADQQVAGHGTPDSVDDPFATEINADVIPASLVDTRGRTVAFPHPNPTADPNGWFITDSVG
ncbi:MAG TPA: alkaline phosphatase family protein, partial [Candidatus Sulfotelmatobacter sp.]|nr:alkaline phosphatase family protein [Candidatus Sulfotelmatobacter sp.]